MATEMNRIILDTNCVFSILDLDERESVTDTIKNYIKDNIENVYITNISIEELIFHFSENVAILRKVVSFIEKIHIIYSDCINRIDVDFTKLFERNDGISRHISTIINSKVEAEAKFLCVWCWDLLWANLYLDAIVNRESLWEDADRTKMIDAFKQIFYGWSEKKLISKLKQIYLSDNSRLFDSEIKKLIDQIIAWWYPKMQETINGIMDGNGDNILNKIENVEQDFIGNLKWTIFKDDNCRKYKQNNNDRKLTLFLNALRMNLFQDCLIENYILKKVEKSFKTKGVGTAFIKKNDALDAFILREVRCDDIFLTKDKGLQAMMREIDPSKYARSLNLYNTLGI